MGLVPNDADVRQVAIPLIQIEAVADDEDVVDGEAQVVDGNFDFAGRRFVQKCTELDGSGAAKSEEIQDRTQRVAGIDDVFDQQDVASAYRHLDVFANPHLTRGRAAAVARGLEEIDRYRDLDPFEELHEKEHGSLEDPDAE